MQTKSCESDIIPTHFLKDHLDEFAVILTKIINKSLELGHFAEDWKVAILRPLVEKRDAEFIKSNFRLVSNISSISKVAEKIVLEQFNEFSSLNCSSSAYQSAYKSGHSCETTILKIINDILWTMERKEITTLVMIDLSPAFYRVDCEILLQIVEKNSGYVTLY